jgi:hypothetical protein
MLDHVAVMGHPIPKDITQFRRRPNLVDYDAVRAGFDWAIQISAREPYMGGGPAAVYGADAVRAYDQFSGHSGGPQS